MKRHLVILLCVLVSQLVDAAAKHSQPNIILIFTDDQGYEDVGCFGSKTIKTPNLDRMAREGLRLTHFYAQPVCGVSRAALMTGSYPIRIAEPQNVKQLHSVPHPDEVTMAEVLKSAGYATAIIGKWHLTASGKGAGRVNPATMPNAQGFDYFYGTPRYNGFTVYVEDTSMRSPLMRNGEVAVPAVESWDQITADYTREALNWIEQKRDGPFFLYLAHNMPHVPVGASEKFKGKSAYGPYGDTIEEIDWSTGEILKKLKELEIDDNTLVIFTSDNGPWVETTRGMKPGAREFIPRDHSGSAGPLRAWKMSMWEGGSRVPFIARWPKRIAANRTSGEILSTLDLLPTFARLAWAKLPEDRVLDGHDASRFLLGEAEKSPRDSFLYYGASLLAGIRVGQWKLVLPRPDHPPGTSWWGRMLDEVKDVQLFDLLADPGETKNLADRHPDVVARLKMRLEAARTELGDMNVIGTGARFFDPEPRQMGGVRPKNPAAKPAAPAAPKPPKNASGKPPVFGFESGKLVPWKLVSGKFGHVIGGRARFFNNRGIHNKQGEHYLTTLEFSADAEKGNDRQTGVIVSPLFVPKGGKMIFQVGGGRGPDTYVALCAKDGTELAQASGTNAQLMRWVEWDLAPHAGKPLFLKVVDRATGGWGHVTADHFQFEAELLTEYPEIP